MRLPVPLPTPGERPFDVVGCGLNAVDLLCRIPAFPEPDTKQRMDAFEYQPGGQAASGIVACARQGWRTRYIGRFGDDAHGELGRRSLLDEGVDISACETMRGMANGFAVILVDSERGTRTIAWHRDPRLNMAAADVSVDAVQSGRVLLVDCHQTEASIAAARAARAAGMATVIDVEKPRERLDELLEQIHVIIAAADLPGRLTGHQQLPDALAAMADRYGAAIVCATLGARGSLALCEGRLVETPAFRVPVVDTTGAGDVFRGGFIAAWLAAGEAAELEDVLRWANATSALKCRALGARAAIPTRAEVDALVGLGAGSRAPG